MKSALPFILELRGCCIQDITASLLIFDRQGIHSGIRHAYLHSFLDCLLYRNVMTESLPLSVDWVHTSSREHIALPNEPLPVDLVLVLLAWVCACDLKDLNEFSHSESSPLPRESPTSMMIVFLRWLMRNWCEIVEVASFTIVAIVKIVLDLCYNIWLWTHNSRPWESLALTKVEHGLYKPLKVVDSTGKEQTLIELLLNLLLLLLIDSPFSDLECETLYYGGE